MNLPADKKAIVSRGNKVVYDCGDRIIKVFNENKPAADVFNEALNLARVEEAGADVPRILEASKSEVGWALATEKVPGITLAERMESDPKNLDSYIEQFVDLQLKLQTLRSPLLTQQKDKFVRMINSVEEIDKTSRYEVLMKLDGMPTHNKLCHGDFNPTNVIIGEDGKLYVCDWAHATQGNGSADAATTYLLFEIEEEHDIAERYLDLYCQKAPTNRKYVLDWLAIVAASELARKRPGEREFLTHWINVADYQ
ncbi:MAG: aminoglycoside phosphotransferase family protein [Atopobiaceae bacterium]|jgi:aminoglycoside phosphotransferase|nr:aminoglycoside phosphotransferase family protein [Atopobiaceae bacterium]